MRLRGCGRAGCVWKWGGNNNRQLLVFSRAVGVAAQDSHSLRGRVGSVAMWGRAMYEEDAMELSLGSGYEFSYQTDMLLSLFELEECQLGRWRQSYTFQLRDSLRPESERETGLALPLPPHGMYCGPPRQRWAHPGRLRRLRPGLACMLNPVNTQPLSRPPRRHGWPAGVDWGFLPPSPFFF